MLPRVKLAGYPELPIHASLAFVVYGEELEVLLGGG
jgi:hypothetical protein